MENLETEWKVHKYMRAVIFKHWVNGDTLTYAHLKILYLNQNEKFCKKLYYSIGSWLQCDDYR